MSSNFGFVTLIFSFFLSHVLHACGGGSLQFIFMQYHVGDPILDGKFSSSSWTDQMPLLDVNIKQDPMQVLQCVVVIAVVVVIGSGNVVVAFVGSPGSRSHVQFVEWQQFRQVNVLRVTLSFDLFPGLEQRRVVDFGQQACHQGRVKRGCLIHQQSGSNDQGIPILCSL
jgi:hypothetical protein